MSDIPLIWTERGNLPVADLEYRTGWQVDLPNGVIVFRETYLLNGEVVKQSVHVYKDRGDNSQTEQGSFL